MVTDKLKELEAARAKLASLEQSVAGELHKELAALPAQYGFSSVADFVAAVEQASGGGKRGRRGRGRPPAVAAAAPAASTGGTDAPKKGRGRKRRARAVITDETRAQVKKMVNDGKTGAQIADALSISLPSVQNIKKALGLVKSR